jgi:hypothetical protein
MQNTHTLPLTGFETYMALDDRTDQSMTCATCFRFEGTWNRDQLERAYREEIRQHPLFRASLRRRFARLTWIVGTHAPRFVWLPPNEGAHWQPSAIDLSASAAPTLVVRHEADRRSVLEFYFHHATCDGMAIFRLMKSMLNRYAGISPLTVTLVDTEGLDPIARRGEIQPPAEVSRLTWLKLELTRILRFFSAIPQGVCLQPPKVPARPADLLTAQRRFFGPSDWQRYRSAAKAKQLTTNDALVSDLFSTLERWNRNLGATNRAPFRIAVPTSLRDDSHAHISACNIVSMVFLDRSPATIKNKTALDASVAAEMTEIKDARLGSAMLLFLKWLRIVPGLMRWFLRLPIRQATIVLTNLGLPLQDLGEADASGFQTVGGVRLIDLETRPPVRAQTPLSLSVNHYGQRLSATLRYDANVCSAAEAESFLQLYLNVLAERAATTA